MTKHPEHFKDACIIFPIPNTPFVHFEPREKVVYSERTGEERTIMRSSHSGPKPHGCFSPNDIWMTRIKKGHPTSNLSGHAINGHAVKKKVNLFFAFLMWPKLFCLPPPFFFLLCTLSFHVWLFSLKSNSWLSPSHTLTHTLVIAGKQQPQVGMCHSQQSSLKLRS